MVDKVSGSGTFEVFGNREVFLAEDVSMIVSVWHVMKPESGVPRLGFSYP
jgi:hypothetical protein